MFLNLNKKKTVLLHCVHILLHTPNTELNNFGSNSCLASSTTYAYIRFFVSLSFLRLLSHSRSLVALGCEPPSPIPPHMTLVRRSERRVRYVCDPLYVFPDTAEPSRELVCTARHTWNRPLPACVGEYPNALLASFFCLLFNAWPACVIA